MPNLKIEGKLDLEGGQHLSDPTIFYTTYGTLNKDKSNVIWVCHALTADSNVFDWWPGLFGENDLFNPQDYFIVSANMLGSCYGTTGPLSLNSDTGGKYYHSFPQLSIRDIADMNRRLADYLGLPKIALAIGGSMGGQQAMEWAITEPERIEKLVLVATNARHSPWGIAYNQAQRMAIEADQSWASDTDTAGINGMKAARATALMSYRSYYSFNSTQQSDDNLVWPDRPVSYMEYQGQKLADRFNAFSYWTLSRAMDSHNVGRSRGGIFKALGKIKARTLVLALEGDNLFPFEEQKVLAEGIADSTIETIDSVYGHDGFLIETAKISQKIERFLDM